MKKKKYFISKHFTSVWPMYKVQKTPSSHPPVPSERFQSGAPAIPLSAALGCKPGSLGGQSQRGCEPGLLPPQRVMQPWGGLCQAPPPSSLQAGIGFHPSFQIPADLLLSLHAGYFQDQRGISPATPGPTPVFSSPTSPVSHRGKDRRRSQMEGGAVLGEKEREPCMLWTREAKK